MSSQASASLYAVAYSCEGGYPMILDSLPLLRKMASRSQRQCPSPIQQSYGTPCLRSPPFRSASRSAVCCSLCCSAKGSTFSIHSEYQSRGLVGALADAIPTSVRLYTWRASLFLLLSTIIVVIPASFCMVLTYRSGPLPSPCTRTSSPLITYRTL